MAVTLTRPTLVAVPSFDATKEQVFTFTVQGTSRQIVANTLIIREQKTNTVVYEEKQETFAYSHTLAANELENNKYYNATVTVFDADNNSSPESIPIQFWCYTTPTISFTNIPENNVIPSPSYNFSFTYNQVEGEELNGYILNLYNAEQVQISSSGEMYTEEGTPPYTGFYTFSGFSDSTTYYIEVVGTTAGNTTVTTGLVEFTVRYVQPETFTLIELINSCDGGYITMRSNIHVINGEAHPDPPTFTDGNTAIDLTGDGSYVIWDEGFDITGDMLTRVWFRNPNPNTEILRFSNTAGQIVSMRYMEGYENVNTDLQAYMEVRVTSALGLPYYIFSNFIEILPDTSWYMFWLTRENNVYRIRLGAV